MASRDYKPRSKQKRSAKSSKNGGGGALTWMLITALLIGIVVFLVYLRGTGAKKFTLRQVFPTAATQSALAKNATPAIKTPVSDKIAEANATSLSPETIETLEKPPEVNLTPEAMSELENAMPQFDFYTILPEKEVVVPDREITARAREERISVNTSAVDTVGVVDSTPDATAAPVTKSTSTYIMQAGSFKDLSDAEKMRTNLASMGIEARIERAKVGEVVWNRIKIGPYSQMNSVSSVRARLRQNGIDVIVTEIGAR